MICRSYGESFLRRNSGDGSGRVDRNNSRILPFLFLALHLVRLIQSAMRITRLRNSACMRNRELVLKMNAEGAYLNEIARAVGTTGIRVKEFLRRNGETRKFPVNAAGQKSRNWKAGRVVDKDGYVMIYCPNHPNPRKHTPYIAEHRLVMERVLGRYLSPLEVVHHKDGNKQNNAPENLQLFENNSQHLAYELKGRCPKWTPEGRLRMQASVRRRALMRLAGSQMALTLDARPSP